ncbi:acetyltransferase [Corynebacterium aquilae DSM 44791]|uniref:Acetyltransferase n=1 Tax=Corynebacterium aquilae DSM 44791 TaxID=1431546 RepID=A0A1L7CF02_9CORY|nr:acetyltransferase [Corynebacterium aquilae DSM 44791]
MRSLLNGELPARPHPDHPGWPGKVGDVLLADGGLVTVRPLKVGDFSSWRRMRLEDEHLIRPVEPTVRGSWAEAHTRASFMEQLAGLRRLASFGHVLPLAIEVDGLFAGQLTIGGIERGTALSGWVGYWVSSRYTGRGVAQAALALGVDHAFNKVGLHRLTATFLPDNPTSGSVLKAVGFRREGYLRGNLHIDGRWRDHEFVALLREDYPETAIRRLQQRGTLRH